MSFAFVNLLSDSDYETCFGLFVLKNNTPLISTRKKALHETQLANYANQPTLERWKIPTGRLKVILSHKPHNFINRDTSD